LTVATVNYVAPLIVTRAPLTASQLGRKQELDEMSVGRSYADFRGYVAAAAVALLLLSNAHQASAQQQGASQGAPSQPDPQPELQPQPGSDKNPPVSPQVDNDAKQSKRILGIFPNYRAVSTTTQLPPLSLPQKFWLATQDSFDYSSFISAGIISGVSQANNSYPEFGHGAKAFGRYYWHGVADQAVGNYMTEAIVPSLTREDPRYYTLGHGGFFKRTGYAVSRLLVTRTDSGGRTFNISEIVGNGAAAGISNTYYPSRERTWTKTGQKWLTQIALDGAFNVLKEFWPDIDRAIFHGKY
jgi:hypothetical protein